MDLLGEKPTLTIPKNGRRVFSRTEASAPQFIGSDAEIKNSLITEGCEIDGTVINSVLFNGVKVEKGAVVKDSVVMNGVVIKKNAKIDYAIIDSDVVIGEGATVGKEKDAAKGITVIGAGLDIADNITVEDGAMVNDSYYKENLKGGDNK